MRAPLFLVLFLLALIFVAVACSMRDAPPVTEKTVARIVNGATDSGSRFVTAVAEDGSWCTQHGEFSHMLDRAKPGETFMCAWQPPNPAVAR